jgi:N-acetylmuramoyl-L-alanine amidase
MLKLVAKLLDSRLVLASMLLLVLNGPAAASDVKSLRLGVHPDHTRLVVDLSTPTEFRIDEDKGGNVIVIELAQASAGRDLPRALAGQGLVRSVALEPRGKGLAILVSLAAGSKVGDYNFLASSGSAPPRVFVDFVSTAPAPSVPPASAAAADAKPTGVQIASATATLRTMKDLVTAALSAAEAEKEAAQANAGDNAYVPPVKPVTEETAAAEQIAEMQPGAGVTMAALPAYAALIPPPKPTIGDHDGKILVALDAGHGGKDPGATGVDGTEEKVITLKMAKQLKELLEATGRYEVLLVREDDTLIPLRKRIEKARTANADIFISIHADHNDNKEFRGASVYTLSETASDAEAAALAARENKEDLITGVDLSHQSAMVTSILIDLAQRETKNMSARLAGYVTQELAETTRMIYDSHRFAGFAVLKSPDVPSILVELGYLSNKLDEKDLGSERHRKRLAKAILRAIDRYVEWQKGVKPS